MAEFVQKRESAFDRRDEIARAARALIVEKGVEGLRTRESPIASASTSPHCTINVPTRRR